ncbi:MAG: polysaccharide deacetylase family protein [Steroidobacteraceae bacterium]
MSLAVLMYHRACAGRYGNAVETLDAHFAYLSQHCHCVLPGEPLMAGRRNVCLSFDDAYCDFFHLVLPLLRAHGLRALLAVAPALIPEATDLPAPQRLALLQTPGDPQPGSAAFCTWPELREIAASGIVAFAAHGLNHLRVTADGVDAPREIVESQQQLEARLGIAVHSFVYPFGACSRATQRLVRRYYRHALRIGGASNASWDAPLLYRIAADGQPRIQALFTPWARCRQLGARYWNRARGR